MNTVRDSFVDLEKRRLQLQENVDKLRASLRLWQAWEIEYEGMKEDVLGLGEHHTQADLEKLDKEPEESLFGDSQTTLLTQNERAQLLKDNKGQLRDSKQVAGLLSRRIDYVQQNVKTITSQLKVAEEKQAAFAVLSNPEVRNEEGLPLTEIREDLDEDGNVISSSISDPSQTAPQVVEALRKAGVQSLPEDESEEAPKMNNGGLLMRNGSKESYGSSNPKSDDVSDVGHWKNDSSRHAQSETGNSSGKPKKRVSFAEDTKDESNSSEGPTSEPISARGENDIRRTPATDFILLDETDPTKIEALIPKISSPVIPADESLEDAALRRQMLQYNMNEVGAVVAELNIDDDEFGDYSDESEVDIEYDSSEEAEEDDFGRTSTRVLSDDYVEQMQELERKLNARAMVNVGPPYNGSTPKSDIAQAEKTDGLRKESQTNPERTAVKGVRFASELDIQEPPNLAEATNKSAPRSSGPRPSVTQNPVVERKPATRSSTKSLPTTKKPSLFKATRSRDDQIDSAGEKPVIDSPTTSSKELVDDYTDQANDSPGPRKPLHSATIVERSYSGSDMSKKPTEPEELDPALLNQQIATEYHRMRNVMIQREGGFLAQEEAETPLAEDEGGEKKISRFKAARLGRR